MLERARLFNASAPDRIVRRTSTVWSFTRVLSGGARLSAALSFFAFASASFAQDNAVTVGGTTSTQTPSITTCVACHGALGAGDASGVPRLAGKDPQYLAHALSMFKAGTRISVPMQAVAQNLSDSDMHALAVYFSEQHPPIAKASTPPSQALVMAGKQLAEMGAGSSVPACFTCHAEGGKGNGARFPSIAGEPSAFTIARLHEFQARAKAAPLKPGTMPAVAAALDEQQIEQAAAYLSVTEPWVPEARVPLRFRIKDPARGEHRREHRIEHDVHAP